MSRRVRELCHIIIPELNALHLARGRNEGEEERATSDVTNRAHQTNNCPTEQNRTEQSKDKISARVVLTNKTLFSP